MQAVRNHAFFRLWRAWAANKDQGRTTREGVSFGSFVLRRRFRISSYGNGNLFAKKKFRYNIVANANVHNNKARLSKLFEFFFESWFVPRSMERHQLILLEGTAIGLLLSHASLGTTLVSPGVRLSNT